MYMILDSQMGFYAPHHPLGYWLTPVYLALVLGTFSQSHLTFSSKGTPYVFSLPLPIGHLISCGFRNMTGKSFPQVPAHSLSPLISGQLSSCPSHGTLSWYHAYAVLIPLLGPNHLTMFSREYKTCFEFQGSLKLRFYNLPCNQKIKYGFSISRNKFLKVSFQGLDLDLVTTALLSQQESSDATTAYIGDFFFIVTSSVQQGQNQEE